MGGLQRSHCQPASFHPESCKVQEVSTIGRLRLTNVYILIQADKKGVDTQRSAHACGVIEMDLQLKRVNLQARCEPTCREADLQLPHQGGSGNQRDKD
mgnify:CR=1 FL=1